MTTAKDGEDNFCKCEFKDIENEPANYCYFCGKNLFMTLTDSSKQEKKKEGTTMLVSCPICTEEIDNSANYYLSDHLRNHHSPGSVACHGAKAIRKLMDSSNQSLPSGGSAKDLLNYLEKSGDFPNHELADAIEEANKPQWIPISKVKARIKELEAMIPEEEQNNPNPYNTAPYGIELLKELLKGQEVPKEEDKE